MIKKAEPVQKILSYRPDIDGLRAIAVLLVLGYHIFPKSIKGGFIGYLITGIIIESLEKGTFTFKNFFSRRIRRIYPSLMLVLASTFLAGWFILLPKEFVELSKHMLGGVGFIANFTLWHDSGYFDALPELKPLLHLWSLGIEEQFYFLWPLALFVGWKYKEKLTYVIILIFTISFLLNILFIHKKPDAIFYFPVTRFWELLIGGLLTLFQKKSSRQFTNGETNFLSVFGALLIFIATLKLHHASTFPGWWALMPTLGTALLISGKKSWINQHVLSLKSLVAVGLISYPLYLWHWPLISFFHIAIGEVPYYLDKIGIIFFSFLLSWLTFKFIEAPLRHGKNTSIILTSLILISLFIGVVSFSVIYNKGYPQRISKNNEDPAITNALIQLLNPNFGGYIAAEWREHNCFLAKGEGIETFKDECKGDSQKPLALLWGDSHAAALYAGLKNQLEKQKAGLAQFTASACPPLLNWDGVANRGCRKINNHILDMIRELKPDVVFLGAAWYWADYDWTKVEITIRELKKIGIKKIILVGSSPAWKEKVPNNIVLYYRKYNRLPPTYTDFNLIDFEVTKKIDEQLEDMASKMGIQFFSILKSICNSDGCRLMTDKSPLNVTSLDQGHITTRGAIFLFKATEIQFLDGLK
jgi:peptidoglycan/LPS O-acetylase OafA/YrhL